MAALALMILVVAILATGNTRHEVYRSNFGRTGGTIGKNFNDYKLIGCKRQVISDKS
jgi:hypothetical protein